MGGNVQNPRDFCRNRLDESSLQVLRLSRRLNRLTRIKRFCTFAIIGYAVFDPTAGFLLLPLAILLVPAVIVLKWIGRTLRHAGLATDFYRGAMARIDDRWIRRGNTGKSYLDTDSLFADDLDLFGRGSLFQFLCTARTSVGRDTLAAWLTQPEDVAEIRDRQAAVKELSHCPELRERLAVLELDRRTFRPETLTAWGHAPDILSSPVLRTVGISLAVASLSAVALWAGGGLGTWPLLGVLLLELGFFVLLRKRLQPVHLCGYYALRTQAYLSAVHAALRNVSFQSHRLSNLKTKIDVAGAVPVALAYAAYAFVVQLPPLLLLACQIVPHLDRWRRTMASHAQQGLAALGELEALASLAQYAFEQPDTTFPALDPSTPCYEATQLGHPLIPAKERVKNDLQLNDSLRLLIVSGSNMSGKSTMLRTIGINAVLALCGGPVCAKQIRISAFSIGTAMRFQDSLEHRTSHFQAVITRLRAVMELQTNDRPLLFLIDEILQGTNSRDRLAGAEALVRKLVDRGALGLVTTHDLELTRIVDTLKGRAANVHFVDRLIDGEIDCDYKMKPGVVQTSNALVLMRKMGLDV